MNGQIFLDDIQGYLQDKWMVNCTASRYCTVIFMALVAFRYLSCCSGVQGG